MPAQIGLTLAPWGSLPLPSILDVVATAGYDGAVVGEPHFLPWQRELGRLRDLWEERELCVAAAWLAGQWGERALRHDELERLRRDADLLAELECPHVVLSLPVRRELLLVVGYENLRQPFALSSDRIRYLGEGLNIAAEVLLDVGLRPSFRNCLGTSIETADEVHQLMDATEPELVSLTLDIGHLAVAGALPEVLIRDYAARVALLICKDVDQEILRSTRAERYDYDTFLTRGGFVPLGQGQLPLEKIIAPVRRRLAGGEWLVVDPERPQTSPQESAERSRQYLADALQF